MHKGTTQTNAPPGDGQYVACKSCGSENRADFPAEVNIHLPDRKGQQNPAVLVFPKLRVCLDCGFTEFAMETELQLLQSSGKFKD
jgi:hypothetical protein